ncbi:hypothetical protein [Spirosoma rhododendri]|uniref:Uncharacterized protein n=1 Tax=Spirosoma rhododendri TaxID=2728024 RepID=A0A7L5E083_9BACT|nr:hypothetical protein [Spirosoma rhododendri]QJD81617.1 hypothetical protein HH216_25045 [Spirosoma rhododendri]
MEDWVKDLQNKIINEEDRILFDEAAGCYSSGYHRSAYIMAWVSLIESLKRKIYEFDNLGDSRSNAAIIKIDLAESKDSSTDKLIFEEAKTCEIIDSSDLSSVNHFWQQRSVFVHPYNKRPTTEEIRYIFTQIVKISLGKELHYNKLLLSDLANNVANKPFYIPTGSEQVRDHAVRAVTRTNENLHPFFFKTFLAKVGEICLIDSKAQELFKLRAFICELFIRTPTSLDDSKWGLEDKVTSFPYECMLGFIRSDTWLKIPERIKEMIIAYAVSENDSRKTNYVRQVIGQLINSSVLEDKYIVIFNQMLDSMSFESAINYYGRSEDTYLRIKANLMTYNFDTQNPAIDYLKTPMGIQVINILDDDSQFSLGRMLESASSNNHWKTQNFIDSILDGKYSYSDWVKGGIAYGSFVSLSSGLFDFDEKVYKRSILFLNSVSSEIQHFVYQKISEAINETEEKIPGQIAFQKRSILRKIEEVNSSIAWDSENRRLNDLLFDELKSIVNIDDD